MNTGSNQTSLKGQVSKKENVQPLSAHPAPGQVGACLVLTLAWSQPVAVALYMTKFGADYTKVKNARNQIRAEKLRTWEEGSASQWKSHCFIRVCG